MTQKTVSMPAYAKINLHLNVLGKRQDGFHEIESIFQRVSIADYLTVKLTDNDFIIKSFGAVLPENNTLYKAFQVFKKETGFSGGAEVLLLKRIPIGAGLGGGSSDAVALLKALMILTGIEFDNNRLSSLALQVGSDCPFFCYNSTAIVSGRGEVYFPIASRVDCFGILIFPNVYSSTVEAYSDLNCYEYAFKEKNFSSLEHKYKLDFLRWDFYNDFESSIFKKHPKIFEAKKSLMESGSEFSLMSGSGSSVFGLYSLPSIAENACKILKKRWDFVKPFVFLN